MKKLKSVWLLLVLPVVIGVFVDYFTKIDLLGSLWDALCWIGRLLLWEVAFPIWAVSLLVIVLVIAFFLTKRRHPRQTRASDYESYVADKFFGVLWCWGYSSGWPKQPFVARCPECKCILRPSEFIPVSLSCTHCGFKREFECGARELQNLVYKEIDRKLVTGEYREVINRQVQ